MAAAKGRKKHIALSVFHLAIPFLMLTTSSLRAQSADIGLTEQEKRWIGENKEMTIAFDGDYAPYSWKDENGEFFGIAVDFAAEIARLTGLEMNYYPSGVWSELYDAAVDGEVDAVATLAFRDERLDHFIFSEPYISQSYYIITRKDEENIKERKDLAHAKAALVEGYASSMMVEEEFPTLEPVFVPSTKEAVLMVSNGNADAVIAGLGRAQHIIALEGISNLQFVLPYAEVFEHFGISNTQPELASIFQKALDAIPWNERIRIYQNWSTSEVAEAEIIGPNSTRLSFTLEESVFLQNHPVWRVGNETDFAPFDFTDGTEPRGYSIELTNLLAQRIGIGIEYVSGDSWSELSDMFRRGEIDLLHTLNKTPEREEIGIFSRPYKEYTTRFVIRQDAPEITGIRQLYGKTVAVVEDWSQEDYLEKNHPRITLLRLDDTEEAAEAVLSGKADAIIGDDLSTPFILEQKGITGLKVSGWFAEFDNGISRGFHFMAPKEAPEIIGILDKALASLEPEELQRLDASWFGHPAESDRGTEAPAFEETGWLKNTFVIAGILFAFLFSIPLLIRLVGKTKMFSLRLFLFMVFLVFGGFIISIGILGALLIESEQKRTAVEHNRNELYDLALELKQSSDDLTRFARTYVVTGDPKYEYYFRKILEIRDGIIPHPKNYSFTYWDEVVDGTLELDFRGETYSLENKMIELGLTEDEQAKLRESKRESDDLTHLEDFAMFAMKGLYRDTEGNYTLRGDPNPELARNILHGKEYHAAKGRIMRPLKDFFALLEQETVHELNRLRDRSMTLASAIAALTAITIGYALFAYYLFQRRILNPITELEHGAHALKAGNYVHRVVPAFNDEIGALASAFNSMAEGIQERTTKLQSIINSAADGVLLLDDEGTILEFSPAAEEIFGYSRDEAVGEKTDILVPQTGEDRQDSLLRRYRDFGGAGNLGTILEVTAERKDGTPFPADLSFTEFHIGTEHLYTGFIRDITERRRETDEIRRLSKVVENSPISIVITDIHGTIEYVNPAFSSITGYSYEEAIGKTPAIIKSGEQPKAVYRNLWNTIKSGEKWQGELINKKKNGERWWESATIFPIFDDSGNIMNFVGLKEDLSEKINAEKALSEALNTMQQTLEVTNTGLWDIRLDEKRIVRSDQWFLQLGCDPEEFRDNPDPFIDLVHPEDEEAVIAYRRSMMNGEVSRFESEFRLRAKDGSWKWILSKGKAVDWDDDGGIVRLLGVHIDITELKNVESQLKDTAFDLEKNKAKLEAILSSLPDFTCIFDENGDYIEIIQHEDSFRVSGVLDRYEDPQTLIGRNVADVIPADAAAATKKAIEEALSTGKVQRFEVELKSSTGVRIFDEKITPLVRSISNKPEVVLVARDITDFAELNKQYQKAKEDAESATRAKSDFLANMSHEIRTPMNAIVGLNNLLVKTKMNRRQKDYSAKIGKAANNLLVIINDILDFSKIEAGKLDIERVPFDLNDVLNNLAGIIGSDTEEKGLELIFNHDPEVPSILIGDPLRLGQVLLNITNNAVKFTERGEVEVSTKLIRKDSKEAEIHFKVRDTGMGLTEEQQGKLFQSFSQADSTTTREFGGTGLGLAISKRLTEMMGGEIGVASEFGRGSTFFFTVKVGIGKEEKKRELPEHLRALKTLIVDDNRTLREVLSSYLGNFSDRVKSVESGEIALHELIRTSKSRDDNYDLVLMDYQLPGMNGIDTSKRIREELKADAIPKIIMVTGFGREEIMRQAEDLELDGFLIKPVSPSMLYDQIMEIFDRSPRFTEDSTGREEEKPAGYKDIRGARLLLVEDNEINQQVAREILIMDGFRVDTANNGREAVDMAGDGYDLILMDLQMPVMDGYEATRIIRKNQSPSKLPIIAMTADAMSGVRERVIEIGMNDYITKPFMPEDLWKVLVKWIGADDGDESEDGIAAGTGEAADAGGRTGKRSDQDEAFPEIEGVEIEEGLMRVGGNKNLYRNLLIKFKRDFSDAAERIREKLDDGDVAEAERICHTVKGVAGNIGARTLQEEAAALDAVLKEGGADIDEALLSAFEGALADLVRTIESADLERDSERPAAAPDAGKMSRELLEVLLRRLESSLKKGQPRNSAKVLDEMSRYEIDEKTAAAISEISDLTKRYDFRGAAELLAGLKKT